MDSALDWVFQVLYGIGLLFIIGCGIILMLLLQKKNPNRRKDD
ncbi:hypothetical protein KP77_06240 [Jeotgalibacillus alimentarius]|uniref:Uncharacterized protein n=1 Tax=Jeotgalibacillus alimentarius TaxID=135826 RepID=A0A0C2VUL8_9BACL|nr:hypothetical protein KP77_06240 [Jeotgalibacillus alimentarius]